MWSNVKEFAQWWWKGKPFRPPFRETMFVTDLAHSLTLFREGRFQVELYLIKPNSTSPWHTHKGVDSLFIFLGGDLEFGDDDREFKDLSMYQVPSENGKTHSLFGKTAKAVDGALHAVRTFEHGGAFLSFEHWKESEPDSVVINWQGDYDGPTHANTVNNHHQVEVV